MVGNFKVAKVIYSKINTQLSIHIFIDIDFMWARVWRWWSNFTFWFIITSNHFAFYNSIFFIYFYVLWNTLKIKWPPTLLYCFFLIKKNNGNGNNGKWVTTKMTYMSQPGGSMATTCYPLFVLDISLLLLNIMCAHSITKPFFFLFSFEWFVCYGSSIN